MPRVPRTVVRRAISIAIVAVAIFVVVLLALILGGVLVLPGHSPSPVTIRYVRLVVLEGNTSSGVPWFGPGTQSINFTLGFPIQVGPGDTYSITWSSFLNFDPVAHTFREVTWNTTPPISGSLITKATTLPALPDLVAANADDQNIEIYLTAPYTPGATYAVTVVLNALPIS